MAKVQRIEMNPTGARALLRDPALMAYLKAKADRIAAAAGPGMEASAMIGTNRARASVITGTRRARQAEAKNRALTKAIDAARG